MSIDAVVEQTSAAIAALVPTQGVNGNSPRVQAVLDNHVANVRSVLQQALAPVNAASPSVQTAALNAMQTVRSVLSSPSAATPASNSTAPSPSPSVMTADPLTSTVPMRTSKALVLKARQQMQLAHTAMSDAEFQAEQSSLAAGAGVGTLVFGILGSVGDGLVGAGFAAVPNLTIAATLSAIGTELFAGGVAAFGAGGALTARQGSRAVGYWLAKLSAAEVDYSHWSSVHAALKAKSGL